MSDSDSDYSSSDEEVEKTEEQLSLGARYHVKPRTLEEHHCYALRELWRRRWGEDPENQPHWINAELNVDPVEDAMLNAEVITEITTSYGNVITVRKFDYDLIGDDFTVAIYAKRRAGKTHLMKQIMKARRKFFPEVVVFSGTTSDCEYLELLPSSAIIKGLDVDVLIELLATQHDKVWELHSSGENNKNIKLMLVFDDCLADGYRYEKLLNEVFFNGRHLEIEIYVISQDVKGLPPDLCSNADLAFCSRVRSQRDKQTIREKFLDFCKNDEEFDSLVLPLLRAEKYSVIVSHMAYPHADPEDSVFVAVFDEIEEEDTPMVMGCRDFWEDCEDELMQHPGGEELLCADEEAWGVITDHTPGFDLAKYVCKENKWRSYDADTDSFRSH